MRGLLSMKPPTIIVPKSIKENVERLFDVHRAMDQSELNHKLIGLDIGEEFYIRKDLKVKAFRTHHVIPSQVRSCKYLSPYIADFAEWFMTHTSNTLHRSILPRVFQDKTPYSQEEIDEVRDLWANYFLNV